MNRSLPDYVIVGAGSAGSVLANRLSLEHKVTLIEAGPVDHHWDFRLHMPAALSHVLANNHYNWFYHSEPEPGLEQRRIYCPRGRVLGGSSSINGMIYVRGNAQDFDNWALNAGLANWSYDLCLPYFKLAETCSFGNSQFRGRSGPQFVSRGEASNPLFTAWLNAGEQAGYALTDDFNGSQQEGIGLFDRTIKAGRRFSTAQAYLRPIAARANLTIINKSLASKIVLEGKTAVGIEYIQDGRTREIGVKREVILCGGAINSPQLLMLSGIGDGQILSNVDIPVRCDLPGVGQNLKDHLEVYIQYACQKPISLYPALKWYNQAGIGARWYLSSTGPGATNHFEAGAFLKSSSAVSYPDLQFHFLPVAMNYDGKHKYAGHGFQVHVGPMKPDSRGSITLDSNDPGQSPIIRFNYNTTDSDRGVMRRGIRLARELVSQNAFDHYRGKELSPGADFSTDRQLDDFVALRGESAYHPSCSCRMGTDSLAVVDTNACVHGIANLRVIDASIMPEITNGNLNAVVIMMAEKLSDVITGKSRVDS